jgi:uncharacterized membrane protein YeaQ/YmgE (transglycosylase-associated protein family)
MGIITRIVPGLAASMLIPGRRSQGLILTYVTSIAGTLACGWIATRLFHARTLARVLQPVHLAHRHRRRGRPGSHLPPDQRAIRRFPPVYPFSPAPACSRAHVKNLDIRTIPCLRPGRQLIATRSPQ